MISFWKRIKKYKNDFLLRKKYCSGGRPPFFKLAGEYLPKNKEAVIIDVGCGDGSFADYLDLRNSYSNVFLLDGNKKTVENVEGANFYRVPDRLNFEDNSVEYIHCSHMIEHLKSDDLFVFLKEIDRVLKKNGILVISAPLLWSRFYDDLTHVRPYSEQVFINYLCKDRKNASIEKKLNLYRVKDLAYRYKVVPPEDGIESSFFVIDVLIKFIKIVFFKLGFKKYIKNGYTLVLKKI